MNRTIIFFLFVTAAEYCSAQTFKNFISRVNTADESHRTAIVDSFSNATKKYPFIEDDTLVHFMYRGNANSVTVPGDANGWNTSAFPMTKLSTTDFWYRTQTFESDARLDYKFVLNGNTDILDPRNPFQVSGGFGPNSELRMPAYIPAAEIQFDPNISHGTLRDTVFFSTNLNNTRAIRIYTPPNYDSSTDRYPVILFHDGLEYISLAQANNVIDYLIARDKINPIIAVFVPPVDRTAEYAGNKITQFGSFIVHELIPYIDSRYRTKSDPLYRATLGASNGGNIALYLAYSYPNVFGNVAAQSGNIISSISSSFQSKPKLNLKFYLDIGTYDIAVLIPLVKNFIPILQSKGYEYRFEEYHEGHSWGNWRAHIDNALEFFFRKNVNAVDEHGYIPQRFDLKQNYPNPFTQSTAISYRLLASGHVRLEVFDMLGRKVAVLVDEEKDAGEHTSTFDIRSSNFDIHPGVYVYRLSTQSVIAMKKMLVDPWDGHR